MKDLQVNDLNHFYGKRANTFLIYSFTQNIKFVVDRLSANAIVDLRYDLSPFSNY